MGLKETVAENAKNFLNSASVIYRLGDYTSASILYFKSFFSVLDFIIAKKFGKAPKDHTERFRILEADFPELYPTLDALYPIYRKAYALNISKEECDKIKENAERIAKKQGII